MPQLDGPRLGTASGMPAKQLIVFVHGYGADGNDLIGLGRQLAPLFPEAAFASPHAPQRCDMNPMGYQWFPLTMRDPSEYERGVRHAGPDLVTFLETELVSLNLGAKDLALVGFSQGTMMSLHVGPRMAGPIAGVVGFSGLLAGPEKLATEAIAKPPVLLVHGDQDEVVPFACLDTASTALKTAGFDVEAHVSEGLGHGIDGKGLTLAAHFLQKIFKL